MLNKIVFWMKKNSIFYLEFNVVNLYFVQVLFVVCRVFVKLRCGNSILEYVLSLCVEESGVIVRYIGIQYDGSDIFVIDGDKVYVYDCVYQNIVVIGLLIRLMEENLVRIFFFRMIFYFLQ